MQPLDVQPIGDELAIKWADGTEIFLPLEQLRRACPCAACAGELDVYGRVQRPPPPVLTSASFQLVQLRRVGTYAVQPVWGDGHATGIYSFEYLRRLAAPPPSSPPNAGGAG